VVYALDLIDANRELAETLDEAGEIMKGWEDSVALGKDDISTSRLVATYLLTHCTHIGDSFMNAANILRSQENLRSSLVRDMACDCFCD